MAQGFECGALFVHGGSHVLGGGGEFGVWIWRWRWRVSRGGAGAGWGRRGLDALLHLGQKVGGIGLQRFLVPGQFFHAVLPVGGCGIAGGTAGSGEATVVVEGGLLAFDQFLQFLADLVLLLLFFLTALLFIQQVFQEETNDLDVFGGLLVTGIESEGALIVGDTGLAFFDRLFQIAVFLPLRLAEGAVAHVVLGPGGQDRFLGPERGLGEMFQRLGEVFLTVRDRAEVERDLGGFGVCHGSFFKAFPGRVPISLGKRLVSLADQFSGGHRVGFGGEEQQAGAKGSGGGRDPASFGESGIDSQQDQGNGQEDLKLFVVAFDGGGFQVLFFGGGDEFGIDLAEIDRSGGDVEVFSAGSGVHHLAQGVGIELGPDFLALVGEEGFAALIVGDGNSAALVFVAQADRNDSDSAFSGGIGGLDRKAIVVFAVGDEDDVLVLLFLIVEHVVQHLADAVSDEGAAARDAVRGDILQHQSEKAVVEGERALHDGGAGEDHETDPVPGEAVDGILDGQFGPFHPVWGQVFGEHALGDIEEENDVSSAALDGFSPRVPAGPGESNHEKSEPDEGQNRLGASSRRAHGDADALQQSGIDQCAQGGASARCGEEDERHQDGKKPQPVEHGHALEADCVHGIFRKMVQFRPVSKATNSKARTANGANNSR